MIFICNKDLFKILLVYCYACACRNTTPMAFHARPAFSDAEPVGLSRISIGFRSKLVELKRLGISTLERLDEARADLPNHVIGFKDNSNDT